MLLLSMIADRELPVQELIELAKRVQIPGLRSSARTGPGRRQQRSDSTCYLDRLLLAMRDMGCAELGEVSNFGETRQG